MDFSRLACSYETNNQCDMISKYKLRPETFFLDNFWSWNAYLIHQVKILLFIWSQMWPQLCWLLNLDWFTKFEHVVLISLRHMCIWCPFLDPHLTRHHLTIDVHWRRVIGLCPLALEEHELMRKGYTNFLCNMYKVCRPKTNTMYHMHTFKAPNVCMWYIVLV